MSEEIRLWVAIVGTTIAKWLMTDDGPAEGETPERAAIRRRKAFGGIIAGILIAYYGHAPLIRWSQLIAWIPEFSDNDKIIIAIVLALTGEHFFRWTIEEGPQLFRNIFDRITGGKGKK